MANIFKHHVCVCVCVCGIFFSWKMERDSIVFPPSSSFVEKHFAMAPIEFGPTNQPRRFSSLPSFLRCLTGPSPRRYKDKNLRRRRVKQQQVLLVLERGRKKERKRRWKLTSVVQSAVHSQVNLILPCNNTTATEGREYSSEWMNRWLVYSRITWRGALWEENVEEERKKQIELMLRGSEKQGKSLYSSLLAFPFSSLLLYLCVSIIPSGWSSYSGVACFFFLILLLLLSLLGGRSSKKKKSKKRKRKVISISTDSRRRRRCRCWKREVGGVGHYFFIPLASTL